MSKTAKPGLLLVVLAGVIAGLWLAAHTGDGPADRGADGMHPDGLSDSRFDADPDGEIALAGEMADPETPGRARPRPDPSDARLVPKAGETCLAAAVEAHDGSVPPGARIALFALDDDRPIFPPAAVFTPDGDGLVRACARIERDMEVVAFAPGWRLTSRRVHPAADARIDLEPLVLERGESVHGRVTAGGAPLARAEVEARAVAPAYEARVDGGRIGWRAGRYVWCATRAETDAKGAYEISGLEPGEHTMRLSTVRQRTAAIDVQKVPLVRANVPGGVADFALPAARLDLSFEAAGTPLCCVEVQIEAGERQFTRQTDDYGHIAFMIQPELAYDLIAGRIGFTTKRTQLRGLTDGERRPETIALEPQTELATLIVDDGGSAESDYATFEFRSRFLSGAKNPTVAMTATRDPQTSKFVLPNVARGSWRVTMRSGWQVADANGLMMNCDRDILVDVPESGAVESKVSINQRGGLRVTALFEGKPVTASLSLLDPAGQPIPGVVTRIEPFVFGRSSTSTVPDDESQLLYSSWCGGSANLIVSAYGVASASVPVTLVPDEIVPVTVVLHRK